MSEIEKEISEWSNSDLCQWLLSKNYRGISDLCKSTGLNGYDIFYITDAILKDEFQIKKFHERQSFIRCISQLISEHLKLTFIDGDSGNAITICLDNDTSMKLNELSNYIAGVFNIDINDIIYLNSEKEMISPSIKIVNMMILYPQKFKSIIIANKKEKANQSQDYNSTSMNNLNQVSQIKSDVESQSKNIYAYDDKKRFTKPPQDMISSSISNLTPHNNPSSNYMNYRPPNKINKNQTELYSTMQSGDFEPNTLNEPYSPNVPPHVSNYNTPRLPKTQTPNRNRNPYSMNNNNINNIPKQIPSTKPTAMFVPNESTMNKDTAQMPIEVRYKSEKRIYRDKNRKGKEIDVGNDYYNNNSNNNLIISNDGSIGDEEMKFKPSYPVNKYSYKSSSLIGKGRGYEGEKKESLNKSSRQFFQGNRVFNEDFLDNE